jgi:hypothetical protein
MHYSRHTFIAGLLLGLLMVVAGQPADASTWTQPYGGCDEGWQAPRSAGAQDCRDHGWIVRSRLVVNPHGRVVAHSMPSCPDEERGRFCSWNINPTDGNGRGAQFWRDADSRAHYVWTRP